jgi:hypothetical protein
MKSILFYLPIVLLLFPLQGIAQKADSVKYTFRFYDKVHGFKLDIVLIQAMDSKGGDRTIGFKSSVAVVWLKTDRIYMIYAWKQNYYREKYGCVPLKDTLHDFEVKLQKARPMRGDYIPAPTYISHSTRFIPDDSANMSYYVRTIKEIAKELPASGFEIYVYSDYDENHDSILSMERAKRFAKVLIDSGISEKRIKVAYKKFYPNRVADDPDFDDETSLTDDYVKALKGTRREKADAYNRRTCVAVYDFSKSK